MGNGVLLTRRALCLGALAAPGLAAAEPLLNTASGRGLFSQAAHLRKDGGGLNLFSGEKDADLTPGTKLKPQQAPRLRISRSVKLALHNANTDEAMTLALHPGVRLTERQMSKLNRFLRDWRENKVKPIDAAVLVSLLAICGSFASRSGQVDVRITSGYRSQATNDLLLRTNGNVARNSMHVQGRAIDFSLPGVPSGTLARTARKICPGGVGRYSNFVHIDSGPWRSWSA